MNTLVFLLRSALDLGGSVKRPRFSLLVALGIVAVSVTGCGSSSDEGLPVRVVNESVWDAHVFGCPQCGKLGLVVEGDPDREPGDGGGAFFGWTEGRPWPTTYKVVAHGVESVCPFIDPEPGKAEGAVGTRDVIYVVDESGKCVVGPGSMDEIRHQRLTPTSANSDGQHQISANSRPKHQTGRPGPTATCDRPDKDEATESNPGRRELAKRLDHTHHEPHAR